MRITIPRIVIAGTHSGCGKTTVASGLMAALNDLGFRVQPFKTGPDFIDPSHHSLLCGRSSRNLDPFMMGEAGVLRTFASASKDVDISVIEGVMGLFDGIDDTDIASTAHVARILRAPVILVVDAYAASRSALAMVRGFCDFDPRIRIVGVIFNRIASPRHRKMIGNRGPVPALGWIPYRKEDEVGGRHLGLVMAHECGMMKAYGQVVQESCDIDRILGAARNAPSLDIPQIPPETIERETRAVIGVARDPAFCFYYQDNIDRLARAGAGIRFFSPMDDLLPDMDAIYLGGGYPELYARELEVSRCRHSIHKMAKSGMPIYGECGGLMYLSHSISTDQTYRMAGVLPACAEITQKIQALGYVKGRYSGRSGSWTGKISLRGHEFHYSRVECDPDARFAIRLMTGIGITGGYDGLTEGGAIGAYTHAYFSDAFCRRFVAAALEFRNRGG
ncbi:MAG TPA: hydrogenobyrinic acid a,c-diamide synthase (glutamine-hydrolyzing) [Methanolinea sp.]|nr:hydrogenobyrinic acid a,c-diamide synthase (glutamine-hydrolyzing) [Methanolinea sp.]